MKHLRLEESDDVLRSDGWHLGNTAAWNR
jgi:hypothetical protein